MLEAIVNDLVERYRCHTVVLYGSRADGTANDESDWDLACIRREPAGAPWSIVHEARVFLGASVDAFIYGERKVDRARIDEGMLRLLGGKVVFDREGFGRELMGRLADIDAGGPTPMDATARTTMRVWIEKTLARTKRGDAEGNVRRVQLLGELLPMYFHLRDRWYRGSKRALAWLAGNDPPAFDAFARALAPNATHAEIEALAKIVYQSMGTIDEGSSGVA